MRSRAIAAHKRFGKCLLRGNMRTEAKGFQAFTRGFSGESQSFRYA